MTPEIQTTFLTIPLAALGCKLYPAFTDPEGNPIKVRVKLLDTIRFMVTRWSHEPEVTIGLPLVAGVPLEEIHKVAMQRLREEYDRRRLTWPVEETKAEPTGRN
jgi:hypothetical protein